MNIEALKNIAQDCELIGEKIFVSDNVFNVIDFVKNTYKFDFLKSITAVDNGDFGIELIYRLFNSVDEEEVVISTFVKDEAESVSSIFDSAVADEKEIYDLFGINFVGNKELKRLYMPESWNGHPLRKDYVNNDERLSWND